MISFYSGNSPIEIKLQQVEKLMDSFGLRFEWDGCRMNITDGNQSGYIMDVENRDCSTGLPRIVESEKIVLLDE